MTNFSIAWLAMFVAFLIIELIAVFNHRPGDTLSEKVWKLIGTGDPKRTTRMWVLRILLVTLFAWLIPHFFTGWLG